MRRLPIYFALLGVFLIMWSVVGLDWTLGLIAWCFGYVSCAITRAIVQ